MDFTEGTIRLWASKVSKERVVPMPTRLREVLHGRAWAGVVPRQLVFPGPGGKRRAQPTRMIGLAMDRIGLNDDPQVVAEFGRATIHTLRHTYASWLRQAGAGLDEVGTMLGHASLEMTKRYASLGRTATLDRVAAILDAA